MLGHWNAGSRQESNPSREPFGRFRNPLELPRSPGIVKPWPGAPRSAAVVAAAQRGGHVGGWWGGCRRRDSLHYVVHSVTCFVPHASATCSTTTFSTPSHALLCREPLSDVPPRHTPSQGDARHPEASGAAPPRHRGKHPQPWEALGSSSANAGGACTAHAPAMSPGSQQRKAPPPVLEGLGFQFGLSKALFATGTVGGKVGGKVAAWWQSVEVAAKCHGGKVAAQLGGK
eukprot:gene17844-biopygen8105